MNLPDKKRPGTWVQTERAAHEAWAALMRDSPNAAMLMHLLVARVGEHNAVVVSQKTMAKIMGRHVNTVKTAFKTLRDRNWIEIRQVGERGSESAMASATVCSAQRSFCRMRNSRIAISSANKSRCAVSPVCCETNNNFRQGTACHRLPNQPFPAWNPTCPPQRLTKMMRNIAERSLSFLLERDGTL